MYPQQQKTAVVEGKVAASKVVVRNAKTGKKVVSPKLLRVATSPWSGKQRTVVDFSRLTTPGSYIVECNGDQLPFEVKENALRDVTKGAIKAFYYQRTGMPIEAKYAGKWARPAGHPDTQVMIHSSAVSPGRPEGTIISSPYGWYDAGDYNKYIVNSAFTIAVMLDSYEQNKAYYDALEVNIPESGNQTADLLDEIMYNLKWMLTMQDPYDGGVYHKLTTPNFEGMVMPVECHQQRYVVQKTVTASYDFAACMAQAARIYKGNKDYPCFSEHAARAALAAYHWAEQHPRAFYNQRELSKNFQPAVSTGEYGDGNANDERFWAATELYLLTEDPHFREAAQQMQPLEFTVPAWGNVATFGTFAWLSCPDDELGKVNRELLLNFAKAKLAEIPASGFNTPSGNTPRSFGWGCLSEVFCVNGMVLLYAHRLTGDQSYLRAAQANMDYILGRNATGYCYVTGFGTKGSKDPHHRLSVADAVDHPFPGMLVGGPNPGQQDSHEAGVTYPSREPDESYVDVFQSYASNEIAINWTAALVALAGWLDAVE
jgi:endoglucanase